MRIHSGANEEDVTQAAPRALGEIPSVNTRSRGVRDRNERRDQISAGQRTHERIDIGAIVGNTTRGQHCVECGEGIAHRTAAALDDIVDDVVVDGRSRGVCHRAHMGSHLVCAHQGQLELLGAAADGGDHLLRIGGGQDEHHMGRRFFEGLEQSVRRRVRQHVHFVEEVHLAPPRAHERCPLGDLAYVIHRVVRRRVELDEVHGSAAGNSRAAMALVARLTVVA